MTKPTNIYIIGFAVADLAHPVERHLAKVKVASSSLVIRSKNKKEAFIASFFIFRLWYERLEKSVAKQRTVRGTVRRSCACRRAQKRAERVSYFFFLFFTSRKARLSRLPFQGRGTTKWWWDSRCLLKCFSVITATTLNQQRKPLRHDFVVPPPLIVEALLLPFFVFRLWYESRILPYNIKIPRR